MDRRHFFQQLLPTTDQWVRFVKRVRRITHLDIVQHHVTVSTLHDLPVLVQLAQQAGVQIAFCQTPIPYQSSADSLHLTVSLAPSLNQITVLNDQYVIAQPCVTVQALHDLGFTQFASVPEPLLLYEWLSQAQYHHYPTAMTHYSGVERVQALLSTGQEVVLGGFGVQDTLPLDIPLLHHAIPELFQLWNSIPAQAGEKWCYAYRIDALVADRINLARLLLGAQNSLFFPLKTVLCRQPQQDFVATSTSFDATRDQLIKSVVKTVFDENDVFLSLSS